MSNTDDSKMTSIEREIRWAANAYDTVQDIEEELREFEEANPPIKLNGTYPNPLAYHNRLDESRKREKALGDILKRRQKARWEAMKQFDKLPNFFQLRQAYATIRFPLSDGRYAVITNDTESIRKFRVEPGEPTFKMIEEAEIDDLPF